MLLKWIDKNYQIYVLDKCIVSSIRIYGFNLNSFIQTLEGKKKQI